MEEDRGTVAGMTVAGVGRATEPGLPVAMEAGMVHDKMIDHYL